MRDMHKHSKGQTNYVSDWCNSLSIQYIFIYISGENFNIMTTSLLKAFLCLYLILIPLTSLIYNNSVQFSRSVMSYSLRPHKPGVYPNSCPLSRWCHPAISSSVIPFPSCPQPFPASGSFPMSQLIAWGGQSTGVSASASVFPKNSQDWSLLGWTGWISLQSKGLSRVMQGNQK